MKIKLSKLSYARGIKNQGKVFKLGEWRHVFMSKKPVCISELIFQAYALGAPAKISLNF